MAQIYVNKCKTILVAKIHEMGHKMAFVVYMLYGFLG